MLCRPLPSGLKLDDSNGHCALTDWWKSNWVPVLTVPMHLGFKNGTFVSHNVIPGQGSPDMCLSETKASHSQRLWAEVSSSAPHLIHRDYWLAPLSEDVFSGCKKASNNLDCVLLKDKIVVFQFSSLSLSATKTSPPCQVLVIQPVNYISSYILPRDPQGQLRSKKLFNRTVSCELAGNMISLYHSMSSDPIQPHSVPG
jgi:hypothetical protein